jgi:hypothetical protein
MLKGEESKKPVGRPKAVFPAQRHFQTSDANSILRTVPP